MEPDGIMLNESDRERQILYVATWKLNLKKTNLENPSWSNSWDLFHCCGLGSVPDERSEIPQDMWQDQKKKKDGF